ncbi:MAG TPA: acyltransferase [Kribbella sp.]|nr:acyltransferase [Kribbella sp.]
MLRSETWLRRYRPEPPQGITSPRHGDQLPHPRTEILSLTGVRAAAACAVVLHHIGLPASAPGPLVQIVQAGYIGVPLFFMLSGLVLAWNYSTLAPQDGSRLWRFYLARVARVMPLYWAVLLFLVVQRAARGVPQHELWRHVLAVQSWSGDWQIGQGSYNAPGWSICVEIFLYALFPFLVPVVAYVSRRYGNLGLAGLMAGAFAVQIALVVLFAARGWATLPAEAPSSGHRWLYRNPLPRVSDFVIGMSLAFVLLRGFRLRVRTANVLQAACVIFVLGFAAMGTDGVGWKRAAFYGALWTVPFALLLLSLAAAPLAVLSRFFATRALVALGTASYAVYLTHRPLLPYLGTDPGHAPSAGGLTPYLTVLVVLGLCLLIGEGAHRFIEVPARRAVLRLARRPRVEAPAPDRPHVASEVSS